MIATVACANEMRALSVPYTGVRVANECARLDRQGKKTSPCADVVAGSTDAVRTTRGARWMFGSIEGAACSVLGETCVITLL